MDSAIRGGVAFVTPMVPCHHPALRPVSTAALLVARAQRLTLRHAQQENNEVRDDRELSYGS